MKITVENSRSGKTFKDISVLDFFRNLGYENASNLCLKINYNDSIGVNALNVHTGLLLYLDPNDPVIPLDGELKIRAREPEDSEDDL